MVKYLVPGCLWLRGGLTGQVNDMGSEATVTTGPCGSGGGSEGGGGGGGWSESGKFRDQGWFRSRVRLWLCLRYGGFCFDWEVVHRSGWLWDHVRYGRHMDLWVFDAIAELH